VRLDFFDRTFVSAAATTFDTDVAIVGYGPSGVSVANFLGAHGVKAIAFERERDLYQRARAVTVNDYTLRCYQSVGLDAELTRNMDPTTALRWRTYAGKELVRVKFKPSTLGHPASMMIYQPVMEQSLRDGAARYAKHIELRFGQEMTTIAQDTDGVTLTTTDTQTGAVTTTRARYALACDGGGSGVRSQLGIKLIGSTLDTKWVVVDARVKRWWPERHLLTFWADKKRPVVDIPLALGNHRWEFPLEAHESEKDFATPEQLWPLLRALGLTTDHVEIHQHAFYKHHLRHAERWREGRVFLIGDAAHLMPPWAGQGMQSGIRDAFNISWKLREVLAGRLPDSLLDSYEPERAPHVAMATRVSEQMGRIIKAQMTRKEKAMTIVGGLLGKLGVEPPESPLGKPPTMERGWLRGPVGKTSAVGRMIPQPMICRSNGQRGRLDDVLGHGFVLLGDGIDPRTLLSPAEQAAWDALGARYIAVCSGAQEPTSDTDVIDLDGLLLAWMKQYRTQAIAVRPDRFVAAAQGSGLGVPQ
jgi:3-(3-hydroxy-phenyl)propionate hydroxylase